jgi:histidinol phosphatase-like PHP family hydrolase
VEQVDAMTLAEGGTLPQVPQDLHVHTTFSHGDGAVVPEQTVALVAQVRHARVQGISDHLEFVHGKSFEAYSTTIRRHGLHVGVEVNGGAWVPAALEIDVDYYIVHCFDTDEDYEGVERLVETAKPVILAHPLFIGTDFDRVPSECLVELNNRYVWRSDWRAGLRDYLDRFRFVIGSDAHQPHWLNQNVARRVAAALGVKETILFES